MAKLEPGDAAPGLTLNDADEKAISLADYAGQRVIVYFYPAAMTPGCTKEAVDFTAANEALKNASINVVGISPDSPAKLAAFREKESITFPLLSDPDKTVLTAWGAYGEKKLYGKVVQGVIRSTFIVDVGADGSGTIVSSHYNVRASGHVERLLRELDV